MAEDIRPGGEPEPASPEGGVPALDPDIFLDQIQGSTDYEALGEQFKPLSDAYLRKLAGAIERRIDGLQGIQAEREGHDLIHPIRAKMRRAGERLLLGAAGRAQAEDRRDQAYHETEMSFIHFQCLQDIVLAEFRRRDLEQKRQTYERARQTSDAQSAAFAKELRVRATLGDQLNYVVVLSDRYEEPSRDNHGVMKVDMKDSEKNIIAFARGHEENSQRIRHELSEEYRRKCQEINDRLRSAKMSFYILISDSDVSAYAFEEKESIPTPDDLLARAEELADALVQNRITREKYPKLVTFEDDEYMVTIFVGMRSGAHFVGDKHIVSVEAGESLEQNRTFIDGVLKAGDPRSVQAFLAERGKQSGSNETLEIQARDYCIAAACKEVGIPYFYVRKAETYEAPTVANRGRITIQETDSEENIRAYILQHGPESKRIREDLAASYRRGEIGIQEISPL